MELKDGCSLCFPTSIPDENEKLLGDIINTIKGKL